MENERRKVQRPGAHRGRTGYQVGIGLALLVLALAACTATGLSAEESLKRVIDRSGAAPIPCDRPVIGSDIGFTQLCWTTAWVEPLDQVLASTVIELAEVGAVGEVVGIECPYAIEGPDESYPLVCAVRFDRLADRDNVLSIIYSVDVSSDDVLVLRQSGASALEGAVVEISVLMGPALEFSPGAWTRDDGRVSLVLETSGLGTVASLPFGSNPHACGSSEVEAYSGTVAWQFDEESRWVTVAPEDGSGRVGAFTSVLVDPENWGQVGWVACAEDPSAGVPGIFILARDED